MEDGELKATNRQSPPSQERTRETQTNKTDGKTDELKQMRKTIEKQSQKIDRLEEKIDSIHQALESVELHDVEQNKAPLDKYPEGIQKQFWDVLEDSNRKGISWEKIASIFGVKKTRCYTIMRELEDYYGNVARKKAKGNQPDKLISKKHFLLDLIREDYPDAPGNYYDQKGKAIGTADWETLWNLYKYLAIDKSNTEDKKDKVDRLKEYIEQ